MRDARSCAECGEVMTPRSRPNGNPKRYCSPACLQRARRRRAGKDPIRDAAPVACAWCGERFQPSHRRHRFCSADCGTRYRDTPKLKLPHDCPDCGCAVAAKGCKEGTRCPPCSIERQRERYRRKNRRRRVMATGTYTLVEIAARDLRRCHLCGKRVNMALSGLDPLGPTIDHLVPLSLGGDDDPRNVALAHRICNVKRGTRGQVQLRLIA